MKEGLKVVIVDDEKAACEVLQGMIEQFIPQITEVVASQDPLAALELVSKTHPDMIFLDINMPQISGFEFLERLQDFKGKIVFTTAYDNYALKAFEFGAFDYLLKPIEIDQLEKTVQRYLDDKEDATINNSDLVALFDQLNSGPKYKKALAVNHRGSMHFIQTHNILFLKGQGNYTEIVCKDFTYMSTKTLKDVEAMLNPDIFMRVHKSYVVNFDAVSKCQSIDGAWYLIVEKHEIPVSRRRKFIIDQFTV